MHGAKLEAGKKRKEREGEGRRGGRDMKERKVRSDCGMKGKEV